MWNLCKHRIMSEWQFLCIWNVILICYLYSQHTLLYIELQAETQLIIPTRSIILLCAILCSLLALFIFLQYRDYDTGKLRWLLLKKYHVYWILCDAMIVCIQLVIFYFIVSFFFRFSMQEMILQTYPKASQVLIETLSQQLIESNQLLSAYFTINIHTVVQLTTTFIALACWCHCASLCLLKREKKVIDWILLASVFVIGLVFSYVNICTMVNLVLCLVYFLYTRSCWNYRLLA